MHPGRYLVFFPSYGYLQQVKENFINSFAEICDSIKASKATLSAAGVTSSDISWDKPTAPAILDNELTDVLWDHILELVIRTGNQNGDFHEITYNKVIETIYDRLSSAAQMALMEAESYPYVLTCISAAIKRYCNYKKSFGRATIKGDQLSSTRG